MTFHRWVSVPQKISSGPHGGTFWDCYNGIFEGRMPLQMQNQWQSKAAIEKYNSKNKNENNKNNNKFILWPKTTSRRCVNEIIHSLSLSPTLQRLPFTHLLDSTQLNQRVTIGLTSPVRESCIWEKITTLLTHSILNLIESSVTLDYQATKHTTWRQRHFVERACQVDSSIPSTIDTNHHLP